MTLLTPPKQIIESALSEDLSYGDITTDSIFTGTELAVAEIRSRQSAVISGLAVAERVFEQVDPRIRFEATCEDGQPVPPNTPIIQLQGPTMSILKAERVALNFLQHLSGIATLTYQFMGVISQTKAKITHTRKTIPGLRELEIQAVVDGGGVPHRFSLSHAVLIKDNHILASGSISRAVERVRSHIGHTVKIEVECDTLEQVYEALSMGVDLILLDNMPIETLQEAVHQVAGRAVLEASGGITLKTVLAVAQTGVDFISTSQITMSAPAADMGLDFLSS